jgi:hypothetical protein
VSQKPKVVASRHLWQKCGSFLSFPRRKDKVGVYDVFHES